MEINGDELALFRWGDEQSRRHKVEYVIDTLEKFNTNGISKWGKVEDVDAVTKIELEITDCIDLSEFEIGDDADLGTVILLIL